ncbi:uncharacterized protein Z518_08383 [Rhinocladiella mackenziei CBS 650.93]|uniref:Uncharacterized protein n=1 Tax=Rhinocladiella mackenziei CBS 650.93 TaxID=1442369 RepID=A0A0D2FKH6_9EURO|nr:uncharacterized protein Z518_08383 [Rhinocladiella mackenziei CBS 650.93]KIX02442.1 hypothetical protein Z518_08383 [Rhinocladiella mackenziei CBS 650.93]
MIFGLKGVDLANNFELIRGLRYSGNFRGDACETAILGVRTVEAMYHKTVLQDWTREVLSIPWNPHGKGTTLSEYKYYRSLTATTPSRIPAVRVSCTPAQNLSRSDSKVRVPFLEPNGCSGGSQMSQFVEFDMSNNSSTNNIHATWGRLVAW